MTNIIFFGGGKLLASLIVQLLRKKYDDKLMVVTSKRQAIEIVEKKLSLKKFLKIKKINYVVANKLNHILMKKLKKNSIGISVGAPWIFNQKFISFFSNRLYNIHGSDLPKNRGGGGFSWQILMNEKNGCATIHRLSSGIDKGQIIFKNKFSFLGNNLPINREKIYVENTTKFFMKKLKHFLSKRKIKGINQNENMSTYWPRLNSKIHGWIDWKWKAKDIFKFINAFGSPYIGAHTKLNNKTVYIKICSLGPSTQKFHPFQSGIIYRINRKHLSVSCLDGTLNITQVFNQNKKLMPVQNFKIGDRFNTPQKLIDLALSKRIRYSPKGIKLK